MRKDRKPAIDPALDPRTGVSRDGQPLSYNRLPASDLAPWIGWLYVAEVNAPPDHVVNCHLLSDTAMIRIQLEGDWTAQTRDGDITAPAPAMYFGPQSRAMPIQVRGSFTSVGLALKPGTGFTVTGLPASDFVDRVVPCEEVGLPVNAALQALDPAAEPEGWLKALEAITRAFLCGTKAEQPDAISAQFELLSMTDPTASIAGFAEEVGISLRQLERKCRRDFGMTPKQVMRRSRALDMASHLRGVADGAEEEEAILRFYDQSHMIHEFSDLFGMTPRQFVERPQPLMTLALESRQARRLATLQRITPGETKPWEGEAGA